VPRRAPGPALLAAAALASGCGGLFSASELRARHAELIAARQKWTAHGIASYRYRFQYLCFCPASLIQPIEITVRGGRLSAVVDPLTGRPAPEVAGQPRPTVDELFGFVESAIDRRVDRLTVAYDPVLGYPTLIRVDPRLDAVDEEQSYYASGLTRID
jgi:hypothetical protein